FVDGQGISELQRRFAFIAEIAPSKAKLEAKLRREFDLDLPGEPLWLPTAPFELAHNDSDLAVGEITLLHFRIDVVPPRIGDIDHFVAVQDPLGAQRLASLSLPKFFGLGPSPCLVSEGLLKPSIQTIYAGLASAHRREDLPCFSVGASTTTAFDALGVPFRTRQVEVDHLIKRATAEANLEGGVVP